MESAKSKLLTPTSRQVEIKSNVKLYMVILLIATAVLIVLMILLMMLMIQPTHLRIMCNTNTIYNTYTLRSICTRTTFAASSGAPVGTWYVHNNEQRWYDAFVSAPQSQLAAVRCISTWTTWTASDTCSTMYLLVDNMCSKYNLFLRGQ